MLFYSLEYVVLLRKNIQMENVWSFKNVDIKKKELKLQKNCEFLQYFFFFEEKKKN